jgi:hypothetical protein
MTSDRDPRRDMRDFILWIAGTCLFILAIAAAIVVIPWAVGAR